MKNKIYFFALIFLILFMWVLYFLNKDFFQLENFFLNVEIINEFIKKNFLISILLYILSYFILVICNFPFVSLLSMIGGFLFGTWLGGFAILIAGTLGAFSIFIIAKKFFFRFINDKILKNFPNFKNYFINNDIELMLLIRLVPLVPYSMQNLVLAGLGARNKKFFYTSLIGMSPWAFIFASLGQSLDDIFVNNQKISIQFFLKPEYLVPICISVFLLIVIMNYKKKIKN